MKRLSLRSMNRRASVHLWLFIITVIAGPLFYLESPKLWSFALLSWALVCATPIAVAIVLIPVIKRCAQGSVHEAVIFRRRLSPRISKVLCVALVTVDCGLIGMGSVLSAQVVADAVSGSEELSVRCVAHKEETSTVMRKRSSKVRIFITHATLMKESGEQIGVKFTDGTNYTGTHAYRQLRKHCAYEDEFTVSMYPRTRVITSVSEVRG